MNTGCPFCVEFSDPEASEFRRLFPDTELLSRTLEDDSEFVLVAGIGAFRPGYLLLIPRFHVTRFSQLPPTHAGRADEWRRSSLENLRRHFGETIVFEHGGSGKNTAGGCIDHAHLHFVPTVVDPISKMNKQMPSAPVADLAELPKVVLDQPYVLVQKGPDMRAYFPQERLPSQYMRRLIMKLEGTPDVWDWAVFPGKEHIVNTMRAVSKDAPGAWLPNV